MLFYAADLPFSLIGDVVTCPYTAYTASYFYINQPTPVPPVLIQTAEGPPQNSFPPEKKEAEKKTPGKDADQGKPGDDKPAQLPMPLLLPMK